ncbi:MAG TPA: hypothetical protein PLW93_00610 [Candidatus Absconditabacterales bacterium]|nr:hypothetical protein [Candidatus Absconditabacterales bacterium]
MTQSTDFTPEDGAEFASLMGINEENNESDVEQPEEVVETDDEEVVANDSNGESDTSTEDEEAPQKATETPKKKSGIAKVLSERNELRARVAELESKIKNNEHTTDEFLEYTKTVSRQSATESQEVQNLLNTYPESAQYVQKLEGYADQTGDLESAYKAFLAVNNPELYVKTFVSKQKQAQINSGKLTPAGIAVPKNNSKPVTNSIDEDDANDILKAMMG